MFDRIGLTTAEFLGITAVAHLLLATVVFLHATTRGRPADRWAFLTLATGVLGAGWYLATGGRGVPDVSFDDVEVPDDPNEVPRDKRLASPNDLHVDLPSGHTLTSADWENVETAEEYLEEHPEATTAELLAALFPEHRGPYRNERVWWTDCIRPGLEAMTDVEVPEDAHDAAHEPSFAFEPLAVSEDDTIVRVSDGDHERQFRVGPRGIRPRDGLVESAWTRVAREDLAEWVERSPDVPSPEECREREEWARELER